MSPNSVVHLNDSDFKRVMDKARFQGDDEVDALVEKVYRGQASGESSFGRLGYNRLVELADTLGRYPECVLVSNSQLASELGEMPQYAVDYFDPIPAPEWLDEEKLNRASRVWMENTVSMLMVLYSSSLPQCYLDVKGIPALYSSRKLASPKYISQRLYETGLMIDDVMDPDGIRVIRDAEPDETELAKEALQRLDPEGLWEHTESALHRRNPDAPLVEVSDEALRRAIARLREEGTRRYIWGKGYLAARKVRALHASMRFMLQRPELFSPPPTSGSGEARTLSDDLRSRTDPWDAEALGVPINQEDLAYTLLTFGYLLPAGIIHWGCKLNREEKDSVLHLWRAVGHIMGVRDDLMTDDWDEAHTLFERIRDRVAGHSTDGEALTKVVRDFVSMYLPPIAGLNLRMPASMIIDQCGLHHAKMILPEDEIRQSRRLGPRLRYWIVMRIVALYYWVRSTIAGRIPIIRPFVTQLLHRSGEELVASFRDAYQRKPFYVPKDLTTWQQDEGVTREFLARLNSWRHTVVYSLLGAVACLIIATVGIALGTVLLILGSWLEWQPSGARAVLVASALSFLVSIFIMESGLPRVMRRRPRLFGLE